MTERLRDDAEYRTRHLYLFIRTLVRYRRREVRSQLLGEVTTRQVLDEQGGLLETLDAVAELRRDYLRNGLYYVKSVQTSRKIESNPVDWPRTIRAQLPMLVGNDVFYARPLRRRRVLDLEDFFHRLHASVITEILTLTGEPKDAPKARSFEPSFYASVAADPELLLEPYEKRTYRDRGRYLLALIKTYLAGFKRKFLRRHNPERLFIRIRSFEYVWEHMLRSLLGNQEAPQQGLPSGSWSDSRKGISQGICPQVDFVRASRRGVASDSRYFCIFDAKDKPLNVNGSSASASDIYKQMIYAQLMESVGTKVSANVLLFPTFTAYGRTDPPIRVLGNHHWPGLAHSRVIEVGIDYTAVVEAYLGDRFVDPERWVRALLQQVELPIINGDIAER